MNNKAILTYFLMLLVEFGSAGPSLLDRQDNWENLKLKKFFFLNAWSLEMD
jgi:hypothetical protein